MAVVYRWGTASGWNAIRLEAQGKAELANEGSEEQFITEHYWGYAAQPDGGCVEYRVTHPAWKVWSALSASHAAVTDINRKAEAVVMTGSQFPDWSRLPAQARRWR